MIKTKIMFLTFVAMFAALTFTAVAGCGDSDTKSKFSRLSPQQKADVWKGHLLYALRGNLTREQRAVIFESLEIVRAETFAEGTERPNVSGLVERMKANFTTEQINNIFSTLRSEEAEGFVLVPVSYTNPLVRGACTCNPDSNQLCERCYHFEIGSCSSTSWGCGPFWAFQCTSKCRTLNGEESEDGPQGKAIPVKTGRVL